MLISRGEGMGLFCYYGVPTFEGMGPQTPCYKKHSHSWGIKAVLLSPIMNLYNTKCIATMGSTLFKPWDPRTFVNQNIHISEGLGFIMKFNNTKCTATMGSTLLRPWSPRTLFLKHSHFWGTRSLGYIMSLDNTKCTAWHSCTQDNYLCSPVKWKLYIFSHA